MRQPLRFCAIWVSAALYHLFFLGNLLKIAQAANMKKTHCLLEHACSHKATAVGSYNRRSNGYWNSWPYLLLRRSNCYFYSWFRFSRVLVCYIALTLASTNLSFDRSGSKCLHDPKLMINLKQTNFAKHVPYNLKMCCKSLK